MGICRAFLLMLVACAMAAGEWQAVQNLQVDQKVEVTARNGMRRKAAFVSATPETIVVRRGSSDESIARAEIRRVRVADRGRQLRNGAIWTAVGAGAGLGIGFAICPDCANEGKPTKFIAPAVTIGAALGALKFFAVPYRTIYESN